MAFQIDENGTISLVQGDSGTLVVSGLDTSKNYTVYFAVTDTKRKLIGNEISVNTNRLDSVLFYLTSDFTNLLNVGKNNEVEIYYYGLKICDSESNLEDTLIPIGSEIGDKNIILVYPKKVEGI